MMSLSKFIQYRGQLFRTVNSLKEVVFVCGNEAGDLDSVMSAISVAYLWDTWEGKPLIPFVNSPTPRVLDMRGEVQHVLHQNGLNTADLLSLDKVVSKATQSQEVLSLILVDHNEPSGRWHRKYPTVQYNVLGVIDHHEDSGKFLEADPRIVQVCGSTASLIVEACTSEMLPRPQSVSEMLPRPQCMPEMLPGPQSVSEMLPRLQYIAPILMQTIIFDTVNLTWRNKQVDHEAVKHLQSLTKASFTTTTGIMKEFEDAIAKVPESDFGIYELLFKDYKLYIHDTRANETLYYGISTLHLPFSSMINDDYSSISEWRNEVYRFMNDEDLQLLVMTNAVREPGASIHTQQLAIFAHSEHPGLAFKLYEMFQERGAQLVPLVKGDNFGLYDQFNITISRKQIHPMTKLFMSIHFP